MNTRAIGRTIVAAFCIMVTLALVDPAANAKTKGEIDASVSAAMSRFKKDIKGGTELHP